MVPALVLAAVALLLTAATVAVLMAAVAFLFTAAMVIVIAVVMAAVALFILMMFVHDRSPFYEVQMYPPPANEGLLPSPN